MAVLCHKLLKAREHDLRKVPLLGHYPCMKYSTHARQVSIWSDSNVTSCSPIEIWQEREGKKEKKKGTSVISGLLGQIVFLKISHPTKMAAPRRARMTHQLTRSGCDSGRVKRIIRCHDIGSVIGFSVLASRYRSRTITTSRKFHGGSWRGHV
jgi:hypothetical protein